MTKIKDNHKDAAKRLIEVFYGERLTKNEIECIKALLIYSEKFETAKQNAIKCCDEKEKYITHLFQHGIIIDQIWGAEIKEIELIRQQIKDYDLDT